MTIIIYHNSEDNCVGLLAPTAECPLPIDAIARKDVPSGEPYRIVPDDFFGDTPRDEWEADFSSPDGYGSDKYGAGTPYEIVDFFTDDANVLKFKVRNISSGKVKEIQA